jgi:hypothetical protein
MQVWREDGWLAALSTARQNLRTLWNSKRAYHSCKAVLRVETKQDETKRRSLRYAVTHAALCLPLGLVARWHAATTTTTTTMTMVIMGTQGTARATPSRRGADKRGLRLGSATMLLIRLIAANRLAIC